MMFLKQIITLVITGSVPHCTELRSFSFLNATFYLIRWCIIIYLWKLQGWKSSDFFFHYFCKHRKPALNLKLWISPLCFLAGGGLLLYTTGQKVTMTVVKNWLKVESKLSFTFLWGNPSPTCTFTSYNYKRMQAELILYRFIIHLEKKTH